MSDTITTLKARRGGRAEKGGLRVHAVIRSHRFCWRRSVTNGAFFWPLRRWSPMICVCPAGFLRREASRGFRARLLRLWRNSCRYFSDLVLVRGNTPCYTSGTPWEGSDDHGQIRPKGQAEQESSEGAEPSAAGHLGFQPRYQNR